MGTWGFPAYSVEERKKRKTKFQVFARKGKMSKLFFVLCLFVVAAMAKSSKLLGAVKLRQAQADCCADCRCGNRCHNCPMRMFDKDLENALKKRKSFEERQIY